VGVASGPGDASRAEGALALPLGIPNQPALRGLKFAVQYGMIDVNSKRAFGFMTTNALEITIQ
jgi:hypothetical protein